MKGKLYVVATPIGNLSDISQRAVDTLKEVDFICAEDTRVTVKLLNHYGIKKSMVSYFEHNKEGKGKEIITRIEQGETAAIVTDAGTPCISDPGQQLVRLCKIQNIEVLGVPGPSAVVTAVSISGILNNRFAFEGFLPEQKSTRKKLLQEIKDLPHTLVFYCSPHKLKKTLADLFEILGNREISFSRELTKKFEETKLATIKEAIDFFEANEPRGEFVLVVAGAFKEERKLVFSQAVEIATAYIEQGHGMSESSKMAASETGYSKRDIYNELLAQKNKDR